METHMSQCVSLTWILLKNFNSKFSKVFGIGLFQNTCEKRFRKVYRFIKKIHSQKPKEYCD